jgi:hypothetical protein
MYQVGQNKLEPLSLASVFRIVYILWVGSFVFSLNRQSKLFWNKHSSLFDTGGRDEVIKFGNVDYRGSDIKTFYGHNYCQTVIS